MSQSMTNPLRKLVLKVESKFKKYSSKGQIVNSVIPDDIEELFDLVRDNPVEYACISYHIQDRTRVLIKEKVDMYSN